MNVAKFEYLCEKFGDQSLPKDERWKSIQSLHIYSSYEPIGSFQTMLNNNLIWYMNDETIGPGFFYICAPDSTYEPINNNYNISWIDLDYITEVTFIGQQEYDDKPVVDITDIMNYLAPGTVDKLPVVISSQNQRVKLEDVDTYKIVFGYNRAELDPTDFQLTFKDSTGQEIEKPTRVGEYEVTIECIKEGYEGSYTTKYTVYSIR